jgi:ribosomal protein S18 acetylase RimI-like enzyme
MNPVATRVISPVIVAPASPADEPAILAVARATEVFGPADLAVVAELFAAARRDGPASGYSFVVARLGREPVGFACYGPTPLTQGTFDLYWIAVARAAHGQGAGSALLAHVEQAVRAQGGRLLLIETESVPAYAGARRLYERHGWRLEARVRDFYAPGNDRLIYAKAIG